MGMLKSGMSLHFHYATARKLEELVKIYPESLNDAEAFATGVAVAIVTVFLSIRSSVFLVFITIKRSKYSSPGSPPQETRVTGTIPQLTRC